MDTAQALDLLAHSENDDNDWRINFFDQLARSRSVDIALEAVHKNLFQIQHERKTNPQFAAMWDATLEALGEVLEHEAYIRAAYGWNEPVRYRDEIVHFKKIYSTSLTTFMLRATKPEKYSEKTDSGDSEAARKNLEQCFERMFTAVPGGAAVTSAVTSL